LDHRSEPRLRQKDNRLKASRLKASRLKAQVKAKERNRKVGE
jgi:hypothetical protein